MTRAGSALASLPPLPTAEEELWRYSRIGELHLGDFAPAGHESTVASGGAHVARRAPAGGGSPDDAFEALSADADEELVVATRRG